MTAHSPAIISMGFACCISPWVSLVDGRSGCKRVRSAGAAVLVVVSNVRVYVIGSVVKVAVDSALSRPAGSHSISRSVICSLGGGGMLGGVLEVVNREDSV
jgi:hypothetical protein